MVERHLLLIGMGTGNPDHLTGQARQALIDADLILIPHKGEGKEDLAQLRMQIVKALRPDALFAFFDMPVRDERLPYSERVVRWHDAIATRWAAAMDNHPSAQSIALLVWGDPSLYDSTLRIAARLSPSPKVSVLPGITAVQALTAAHAVPLNTVNGPITITTGRRLREEGWPQSAETLVVMLDGDCRFAQLEQTRFHIWWGAYLGMPQQILAAGPLEQVCDQIIAMRAAARAQHGWIMDTYMLRCIAENAS